MSTIPSITNLKFTDSGNFFLIAGPCVIESKTLLIEVCESILSLSERYKIPFIFKASYRKANRSKIDSFTGIGDMEGLEHLVYIRDKYQIPVITDIHSAEEAVMAAKFVDILQIPAFLCRQTDILAAAAKTNKWVNIKKGQFLSPQSMKFAVEKVQNNGNHNIMLTERGTMLGYNDLVVDFRSVPIMQSICKPVIVDVTHSLQQPNQASGITGGNPEMIETMAKSAIAVGADGIFLETHPNPAEAKSDGANMLRLDLLEPLIKKLVILKEAVNRI